MEPIDSHSEIVQVPTYDSRMGLRGWHGRDEYLSVRVDSDGSVTIFANPAGLRGLARELLSLAQQGVPNGNEIYLMSKGQAPSLAQGSSSLRLVRSDE